jgi:ATP-binding cassette subfamily B (MDR/TAP) protein 9
MFRLSTIQTADRIIVMENGNIVEVCFQLLQPIISYFGFIMPKFLFMALQDGKHSELVEKNGLYSRLARRQNDDLN